MKKVLFLVLLFVLSASCQKRRNHSDNRDVTNREPVVTTPTYGDNNIVTLGLPQTIELSGINKNSKSSFSCSFLETVPVWVAINSESCAVDVRSIKAGDFGPYTVSLDIDGVAQDILLSFKVEMPDESKLPRPTSPVKASKFYQTVSLASDSNYIATFSATGVTFMNATNPYAPDVVAYIAVGGSLGMPQALTSTPNFIHLATDKGYVITFDWTDLNNPKMLEENIRTSSGQNYDIATDGEHTLFVANTDKKLFSVVDIKDPRDPKVIFKFDRLSSYAAGVAYINKHAYVTDFDGSVFVFAEIEEGKWDFVSEVATAISNPSRPLATDKYLIVTQYGGSTLEVFSLEDLDRPRSLKEVNTYYPVQIYSRVLIHDDKLYVAINDPSTALILVFDTLNGFSDFDKIQPRNKEGQIYEQVSLALFRNDSFLAIVGYTFDSGKTGIRDIFTNGFPLKF